MTPGTPRARIGLRRKLEFIRDSFVWRSLRMRVGRCPICGPSVFVRLMAEQLGTRCVRCGGSPIALALVTVLRSRVPRFGDALVTFRLTVTLPAGWDAVSQGARSAAAGADG